MPRRSFVDIHAYIRPAHSLFKLHEPRPLFFSFAESRYLIEPGEGTARPEQEADTQTDDFEERPQTPDFVPKKTGVDASTQIEVSDKLFDFEAEIQPMLAVLVGKVRRWVHAFGFGCR